MTAKAKEGAQEQKDAAELVKVAYEGVAAFVGGEMVQAFAELVEGAAEFTKTNEQFGAVFAGNEEAANKLRDTLTSTYNLSTDDATKFLTQIQKLQIGLGVSGDEATKFSGQAVEASKVLAQFGTGNTQANLQAIQQAFLGQTRGLRELNVNLSESDIIARATSEGYKLVGGQVDQVTRQQIILETITKNNSKAFQEFGKAGAGLAEPIETLKAKFSDLKLALGLELQDSLKKGGDGFAQFLSKVDFKTFELGALKTIQVLKVLLDGILLVPTVLFELFTKPLIQSGADFVTFAKGLATVGSDVGNIFEEIVKKAKGVPSDILGASKKLLSDAETAAKDAALIPIHGVENAGKNVLGTLKSFGADALAIITENQVAAIGLVAKGDEATTNSVVVKAKSLDALKAMQEAYDKYIEKSQTDSRAKAIAIAQQEETDLLAKYGFEGEQRTEIEKSTVAKLQAINEKYNKKQVDDILKAAKQIVDTFSSSIKVIDNLFKLSNVQQEKELQAVHDKQNALDAQHSSVLQQRGEEDYETQKASLEQQIADAQKANDTKTASDAKRQLDRLNQDHDYQTQKDALDAQANQKDKELKQKQWEQAHAIQILSAIAAAAQASISAYASAAAIPDVGFILGPIAAAAAAAFGSIQVAVIAAQSPPSFAKGGITPGGTVLVGEQGPEMAELPAGTKITPANQTRNILSGLSLPNQNRTSNSQNISTQNSTNVTNEFHAHGVQNPIAFVNQIKRQFGDNVFESAKTRQTV